jgi:hypothetical protein
MFCLSPKGLNGSVPHLLSSLIKRSPTPWAWGYATKRGGRSLLNFKLPLLDEAFAQNKTITPTPPSPNAKGERGSRWLQASRKAMENIPSDPERL